jgi:hypothetical protein
MTDVLRRNGNLAEMLGGALRDGGHALGSVPGLLKQILADDGWRRFTTQRGEVIEHERFADFVTTPPLKGLGASIDLVKRVVAGDVVALDLLDRALQNPGGRPETVDNIHSSKERPSATSKDRALRKLRKDAPALHEEVLAGRLSAHAAMIRAGYSPRTFTVRADSPESIANTLRRQLDPEELSKLARLLQGG